MSIFSPHFRTFSYSRRGFTLIEILVVCFIIGVLFVIVIQSLNSAQVKARDARRLKDLDTMQAAVEQYYRDNGHYPITNCSMGGVAATRWTSFDSTLYGPNVLCSSAGAVGSNTLSQELATYFPSGTVPKDPLPVSNVDAGYLYISDTGARYCILFWKTPENMNNFSASREVIQRNGRCLGGVNGAGQCLNASGVVDGSNNIYYGTGAYAAGC